MNALIHVRDQFSIQIFLLFLIILKFYLNWHYYPLLSKFLVFTERYDHKENSQSLLLIDHPERGVTKHKLTISRKKEKEREINILEHLTQYNQVESH
jgi:hypothetical protein